MHTASLAYVAGLATQLPCRIYEAGSRNVNGDIRELFPRASWLGVDQVPGPNVDLVADASAWLPEPGMYDYAISTEVFEHALRWPSIVFGLVYGLRAGGRLIVTCAGPNRRPHSGTDGGTWLQPGEWYSPVHPADLERCLLGLALSDVEVRSNLIDVQATAVRR